MLKPKSLLIYYGWVNAFNSADNGWDNKKVAKDMARYNMIVFGSGIEETTHGDNANINIVLPRIKVLNPECELYGYVTTNQTYSNFKTKVDKWINNRSVEGIMFDEAGYDYGSVSTNGREALNAKIDYCHSKGLKCFINAWEIQHIFGENEDVSYPDTTWNANGHDINLSDNDWYLLESFAITAVDAYESKTSWKARGEEALEKIHCNVAGSGCIEEGAGDQDKFDFIYTSSLMFDLDAISSGDYASSVSYGASSAKTKKYVNPDICGIGDTLENTVVQDDSDTDVYFRFLSHGRLKLDFSSGSESSEIEKY